MLAARANHLCTRLVLVSPAPVPCPNPHNRLAAPAPCGSAGAPPPDAISCLGAFRTPAAGARGEIVVRRHPRRSAQAGSALRHGVKFRDRIEVVDPSLLR